MCCPETEVVHDKLSLRPILLDCCRRTNEADPDGHVRSVARRSGCTRLYLRSCGGPSSATPFGLSVMRTLSHWEVGRHADGLRQRSTLVDRGGKEAVTEAGNHERRSGHRGESRRVMGFSSSPPPHPWPPQPDPVYPCTTISHNRNSGRRGDLVTPQGGRLGDWTLSGPAGPLRSYVKW